MANIGGKVTAFRVRFELFLLESSGVLRILSLSSKVFISSFIHICSPFFICSFAVLAVHGPDPGGSRSWPSPTGSVQYVYSQLGLKCWLSRTLAPEVLQFIRIHLDKVSWSYITSKNVILILYCLFHFRPSDCPDFRCICHDKQQASAPNYL